METPYFSVICVFNDQDQLNDILKSGINNQKFENFETVFIDNRNGEYGSAAAALNNGAEMANGEFYIFMHQDVKLPPEYLSKAKNYISEIDNLGIAGAASVRKAEKGNIERVNVIKHSGLLRDYATDISEPTEVATLDELLLIIPKGVFNEESFSEEVCQGWHLYGIEYSVRMQKKGKR